MRKIENHRKPKLSRHIKTYIKQINKRETEFKQRKGGKKS